MEWFGESWGAPVNRDCPQVEPPVGVACERCDRFILPTDQGMKMETVVYHRECFYKTIMPHDKWWRIGLVPDKNDGFDMREDGLLHCPTCHWAFNPANGGWTFHRPEGT